RERALSLDAVAESSKSTALISDDQMKLAFRTIFLYLLCTDPPVAGIKGDPTVRRIFMTFVFATFLNAPAARGQAGPVEGGHDLQVWTGGGHGVSGSQSGDGLWNAGFRYGLIL